MTMYFLGMAGAAVFVVYASKITTIRTTALLIMFDFMQVCGG